ncbi:hypothetical protein FB382_000615 [Nocardioides ginsengisegetis]|uniref:Ig-like domain (Group 3) n=1 Tax=Nocardioides ginsengisegetis TaxID=661491 RepID=A0A7W3IXE7_9ACTN|nr:Ig-like domain repeat protein [Nocardioides ginsengisegetis]MBA8802324.1 hypothetical protein [Nocardioides ginsengisegetis]
MKISAISKRLATVGVATALAAGAMVGATATSASAASASNDYTCTVPLLGAQTFPVTISSTPLDLVSSLPAGLAFPAGALDALSSTGHAIDMTMTAPAIVVQTLAGIGTLTGVSAPALAIPLGSSSVPVSGLALTGPPAVQPDGSAIFNLAGSNGAFAVPAAGEYDITMPSAFQFIASTTSTDFPNIPVDCTTAAPATIKHLTVTKNNAAFTSIKPAVTPYKASKAAKLVTKVGAANHVPTGMVIVKEGTKTLGKAALNSLGKAVVNMGKLSPGKHALKVLYKGDSYSTAAPTQKLTVKSVK